MISTTDKCEEYRRIDLAWLRREGMLEHGRMSTMRWTRGGRCTGAAEIAASHLGIHITKDGASEFVPFTYTATPFNGRRRWLGCPCCGRACRVLYGGSLFRCRECRGLRYQSQWDGPADRTLTRMRKLRERLGGALSLVEPFPRKPKEMHWRTYQGLRDRSRQLEREWCAQMGARLAI